MREQDEEASRIFLGEQALIRAFKAHIRTATEDGLRQCRFPGLPGSDDRDNLEFAASVCASSAECLGIIVLVLFVN